MPTGFELGNLLTPPWDDKEKVETFTVQPQFEGKAAEFGMVIPVLSLAPTPRQPPW